MAQEIERKFLVRGDFMPYVSGSERLTQGYLCSAPERTVRVRVKGDKSFLTIKGQSSADGLSRYEWEKEIPLSEARELLALCEKGIIDKTRHIVSLPFEDSVAVFEVDVFHGENQGLILAEIELESEGQSYPRPEWLGEEVTGDVRYYNSQLSSHPFTTW